MYLSNLIFCVLYNIIFISSVNGSNNTAVVNPTILETLSLPFTEGPSKNTSNM